MPSVAVGALCKEADHVSPVCNRTDHLKMPIVPLLTYQALAAYKHLHLRYQTGHTIEDTMVKIRKKTKRALKTKSSPEAPANALATALNPECFRFLDLPPEIRNAIYSYSFCGASRPCVHDLENLGEPAITVVSHQVRNEALPLSFAECAFQILVAADLCPRAAWRTRSQEDQWPRLHLSDGTTPDPMVISRPAMQLLQELEPPAIFRHVTFLICEADVICRSSHGSLGQKRDFWPYSRDGSICGRLSLTVAARTGTVAWEFSPGQAYDRPKRRLVDYKPADVDAAVGEVVAGALAVAARPEFLGFTLQDLQTTVAEGFRFDEGISSWAHRRVSASTEPAEEST